MKAEDTDRKDGGWQLSTVNGQGKMNFSQGKVSVREFYFRLRVGTLIY